MLKNKILLALTAALYFLADGAPSSPPDDNALTAAVDELGTETIDELACHENIQDLVNEEPWEVLDEVLDEELDESIFDRPAASPAPALTSQPLFTLRIFANAADACCRSGLDGAHGLPRPSLLAAAACLQRR